jgi:hypothetical protein
VRRTNLAFEAYEHPLYNPLSLLCCLSLGIDYEIRSKMLDYWVGLSWVGLDWVLLYYFSSSHYTITRAFVHGLVWFGSGVREEECTIYKWREL